MVSMNTQLGEIVLFYAEESLLVQVSEWICDAMMLPLNLVSSCSAFSVTEAMNTAECAIIDATVNPGKAMDVLQLALPLAGRDRLAVYTECMHDGLELFVRVRGVPFLLGPMSQTEWEGVFPARNSFKQKI